MSGRYRRFAQGIAKCTNDFDMAMERCPVIIPVDRRSQAFHCLYVIIGRTLLPGGMSARIGKRCIGAKSSGQR